MHKQHAHETTIIKTTIIKIIIFQMTTKAKLSLDTERGIHGFIIHAREAALHRGDMLILLEEIRKHKYICDNEGC